MRAFLDRPDFRVPHIILFPNTLDHEPHDLVRCGPAQHYQRQGGKKGVFEDVCDRLPGKGNAAADGAPSPNGEYGKSIG